MRFSICNEVSIGEFSDRYLVFLAAQMRLLEINATAKRVLDLIKQNKRVIGVVSSLSQESGKKAEEIFPEVSELILELLDSGVIRAHVKWLEKGGLSMSKIERFMVNPGVSCRVEDEDGAILFNPESNSVQIINPIGLHIWQFTERLPRTLKEVEAHIRQMYVDAPAEQVEKDIRDFVLVLKAKGFVKEVADE